MKDLYLESLYDTLEFIHLAKKAIDLAIVTDPVALDCAKELEIITHDRIASRLRILRNEEKINTKEVKNES